MNFFGPDIEEEVPSFDPDSLDSDTNLGSLSILKGQLFGSAIYIVVLILSIIILYNQILTVEKKEPFLTEETVSDLNILNRVVVLLLVLYFFYTSFENIRMTKENGEDTRNVNLQWFASLLTVVSAIIVLYVSLSQSNKTFVPLSSTDNPNL